MKENTRPELQYEMGNHGLRNLDVAGSTVEVNTFYGIRNENVRKTSLFLYGAPKKYFFAPTSKHNGAPKSKKAEK